MDKPPINITPKVEELPGDLSRLAAIIEQITPGKGVETVLRIAAEFKGTYIYCHSTDALWRAARDRWIREQYDAGTRVPDIARAIERSERRVWTILGKEPEDDRQMKLF